MRLFGTRTRHWAASVKNQVLCFEKAELLFERSEFNSAETKTANFWQRSRPCRDFSLVRFFWSSKEMNEKTDRKSYSQNYKAIYRNPLKLFN